jgi:hypothetical protein
MVGQSQAPQAGQSEDGGIGLAAAELGEPGLDIAAQRHDLEIGPGVQRQRGAARRRGGERAALRQLRQAGGMGRDQGVARILAR